MIKVIDIQRHISLALKTKFPSHNIYAEGNRAEMNRPAFHISVRPLLTTGAMKQRNKIVNVDISYISEKGSRQENLLMIEQLEELFHLKLKVYDRQLYIQDLSISEVDTVLTLRFTLDYNVGVARTAEEEAFGFMEKLTIAKGE